MTFHRQCSPVCRERTKDWNHALCLIYYPVILSTFPATANQSKSTSPAIIQCKISKPLKLFQNQESIQKPSPGLTWSFPVNNNKICHCLYGNRRNLGYKYFTWNCDIGILSENKLEDITFLMSGELLISWQYTK